MKLTDLNASEKLEKKACRIYEFSCDYDDDMDRGLNLNFRFIEALRDSFEFNGVGFTNIQFGWN